MAGALARLHVFECHVVDRGVVAMRMADVLEHLMRGGPDIHFVRLHPIAVIRRRACSSVRVLVANPGIV